MPALSGLLRHGLQNTHAFLRQADFYGAWERGRLYAALTLMNDGCAYLACEKDMPQSWEQDALALGGLLFAARPARLEGFSAAATLLVHQKSGLVPVFESEDKVVLVQNPFSVFPDGLTFRRVDADDRAGIRLATEIYNQTQDESWTAAHCRALAREMEPPEGVYLALWDGQTCATMSVDGLCPRYARMARQGVLPAFRGRGVGTCFTAYLAGLVHAAGRELSGMVGAYNASSMRSLLKAGSREAGGDYRIFWYR